MTNAPAGRSSHLPSPRAAWQRREVVQGLAAVLGALPAAGGCRSLILPSPAVSDHRRPGDPDDTAAALRALSKGLDLYFPAGRGSGEGGAYLLRSLALPSGATLRGDGEGSILRVASFDVTSVILAVSETIAQPLENITLHDLRIEGMVADTGFREHWNLVSMSGVSGLRIERVQFVGFAGDGLYLGAEREGPVREPRVIRNVTIRDCLFDGVNRDNRNGISVTGGTGITIDRCSFRRCTRGNMPGPIDFEPDAFPFYRLERLRVTNCDFEECGGNVGQVALIVPTVVAPPRQVLIEGNSFRNYRGTGGDVAISINREPDAAMPDMACTIRNNVGVGGHGGVQIFSGKGVTVTGNRWTRYSGSGFLGFTDGTAGVMDVLVSDRFDQCGWKGGVAFAVYKGTDVRLQDNIFLRSGHEGPGSAPLYLGTGRIRRFALVRNDFRDNPAVRGLVIVERGGDYVPTDGKVMGNVLPDGLNLPPL